MGRENTRLGGEMAAQVLSRADTLYLVGIGGVGMSGLARLARARGFAVCGEDKGRGETVQMLEREGISVAREYGGLPSGRVAVVYSAAIPREHPALSAPAPILSRADLLAAMMHGSSERVTVAGMHGKSSVTAMLDCILSYAGLAPTTVSGGSLTTGETLRNGGDRIFLAEACEYADSFLSLSPTVAIALNLEHEHPDYFPDLAAVERSFEAYLSSASRAAVIPAGDARLIRLAAGAPECVCFGGDGLYAAERTPTEDGERFLLRGRGIRESAVYLPAIGWHAVQNALAAFRTASLLGVDPETSAAALRQLVMPKRRLQLRLRRSGALWYDDYAHHPTELRASLSALRERTSGRLLCLFQPHTYSRTRQFLDDFAAALSGADLVLLLPIYAARETETLGASSEALAERIGDKATAAPDIEAAAEYLLKAVREGDTVAVMGAGDVDRIFELV